jgi:ABC-2 type transport system ATP-binding protein
MVEVSALTKRYGDKIAVNDLSFTVRPGVVTGFLGPNGAGESTTMRVIAGLDEPTSGSVRVNSADYRQAEVPMAELGILLEAKAVHSSRSAYNHLLALAQTNGTSRSTVNEGAINVRGPCDLQCGAHQLGRRERLSPGRGSPGCPADQWRVRNRHDPGVMLAGVVGAASIASAFAGFFLGQSLLPGKHLLRNTAAGISSRVALFLVIPPVPGLLPTSWSERVGPYLPANAGEAFWGNPTAAELCALAGLLVLRVGGRRGGSRSYPARETGCLSR